jgi:hypothetical protein
MAIAEHHKAYCGYSDFLPVDVIDLTIKKNLEEILKKTHVNCRSTNECDKKSYKVSQEVGQPKVLESEFKLEVRMNSFFFYA